MRLLVIFVIAAIVGTITVMVFASNPETNSHSDDKTKASPPFKWSSDLQNLVIFKGQVDKQELNLTSLIVEAEPPASNKRPVFKVVIESQTAGSNATVSGYKLIMQMSKGPKDWTMTDFSVDPANLVTDKQQVDKNWLKYKVGNHYKCSNPKIITTNGTKKEDDGEPRLSIELLELELDRNRLAEDANKLDWQTEPQECEHQ